VAGGMIGATAPKYEQERQLTEVRMFERSQVRIDKALCRLSEAIEHIGRAFDPVISPDGPNSSIVGGCDKEPTPPQSEFERFISATESRIHTIAQSIDSICERSSV